MTSEDINFYNEEARKALDKINSNLSSKRTELDFQIVLAEKLGYTRKESTCVVNHRLTWTEMLEKVEDVDWDNGTEIAVITFNDSILPSGVPSRIDEKQVKVNGEVWRIHKYDKDHCPSNPHGHNVETGYKLHLGNGELYNYKCDPINERISTKDLIAIRQQLNGFILPQLTV